MSQVQIGSEWKKARITRPFSSYGSGDPTFIVGRHSVRFGDGLERAKRLHPPGISIEVQWRPGSGGPSGHAPRHTRRSATSLFKMCHLRLEATHFLPLEQLIELLGDENQRERYEHTLSGPDKLTGDGEIRLVPTAADE
jgi:hypothetical protein